MVWIVTDINSGEVISQLLDDPLDPAANYAFDPATMDVQQMNREGDLLLEKPVDGEWVLIDGALDEILHARIDQEVDQLRRRFITAIAGQETVYSHKEQEALAWTAGSDPEDFPYLHEEATRKGVSVEDLVNLVLTLATQWRYLSPRIEGARTAAKDAVSAATTIEAKRAAAQVDWDAITAS